MPDDSRASRPTDNLAQSIRQSYDRLADEYARKFFNELQNKPLDREVLDRFAAEVRGRGEVCDMGCGPGHIARHLRDTGIAVFGLDISQRMLEEARQLNPDICFRQGDMMALDLPDRALAGIAAFYAIVNIPKESLPRVFREMMRVLEPGGWLLLAFHMGDETLHLARVVGPAHNHGILLFSGAGNSRALRGRGLHNRGGHRA